MKRQQITSFYLETLLLIVIFVVILLVLTQVFALGKIQSAEARDLTNAVCLAANAAEALAASDSPDALAKRLDEGGNVHIAEDGSVYALYDLDMSPNPEGLLLVNIALQEQPKREGRLLSGTVTVWRTDRDKEIYRLETAVFCREADA